MLTHFVSEDARKQHACVGEATAAKAAVCVPRVVEVEQQFVQPHHQHIVVLEQTVFA
jgi:hypothetical protein